MGESEEGRKVLIEIYASPNNPYVEEILELLEGVTKEYKPEKEPEIRSVPRNYILDATLPKGSKEIDLDNYSKKQE